MLKERIRFVFLRMLDREKLLEVTPYHITLHEVYSKLGYANFGTEPCNIKEYDTDNQHEYHEAGAASAVLLRGFHYIINIQFFT